MEKYPNYYIFPNFREMYKLKRKFINSMKYSMCLISANSPEWFNNKSGIYICSIKDNFVINEIQSDLLSFCIINDFIRNGITNDYKLSCVKNGEEYYFILSWLNICKDDRSFTMKKAVLVNEDIYNIYMIKAKKLLSTTTPQDLSRYSKYFSVFEKRNQLDSISSLEQEFNSGVITEEEMISKIHLLDKENEAILSLKRK